MTLIGRFLTGEYKIRRNGAGTYVRGRYVPGKAKTFMVSGSMQPSSARALKLPEEGNRLRQYWKFFTDEKVVVNSMATLSEGDIVTIDGDEYRAMDVTQWSGTDLDHFITALWREPQQASDGKGSA